MKSGSPHVKLRAASCRGHRGDDVVIAMMGTGILAGALALAWVMASGGSVLLALAAYVLGGSLAATALAGGALWRSRLRARA